MKLLSLLSLALPPHWVHSSAPPSGLEGIDLLLTVAAQSPGISPTAIPQASSVHENAVKRHQEVVAFLRANPSLSTGEAVSQLSEILAKAGLSLANRKSLRGLIRRVLSELTSIPGRLAADAQTDDDPEELWPHKRAKIRDAEGGDDPHPSSAGRAVVQEVDAPPTTVPGNAWEHAARRRAVVRQLVASDPAAEPWELIERLVPMLAEAGITPVTQGSLTSVIRQVRVELGVIKPVGPASATAAANDVRATTNPEAADVSITTTVAKKPRGPGFFDQAARRRAFIRDYIASNGILRPRKQLPLLEAALAAAGIEPVNRTSLRRILYQLGQGVAGPPPADDSLSSEDEEAAGSGTLGAKLALGLTKCELVGRRREAVRQYLIANRPTEKNVEVARKLEPVLAAAGFPHISHHLLRHIIARARMELGMESGLEPPGRDGGQRKKIVEAFVTDHPDWRPTDMIPSLNSLIEAHGLPAGSRPVLVQQISGARRMLGIVANRPGPTIERDTINRRIAIVEGFVGTHMSWANVDMREPIIDLIAEAGLPAFLPPTLEDRISLARKKLAARQASTSTQSPAEYEGSDEIPVPASASV